MSPRYVPLALLTLTSLCCAPPEPPAAWTAEDVEVLEVRFDPGVSAFDAQLEGDLQNHTDHVLQLVEIHAVLEDEFDTVLGRPSGSVIGVQPGERARFVVPLPSGGLRSEGTFSWRLTHLKVYENDDSHEVEVPGPERYGAIR